MRIEWRAGDRASSTAVRNLHLGVVESRARALHAVEGRCPGAARPRDVNSANTLRFVFHIRRTGLPSQYCQNSLIEVR